MVELFRSKIRAIFQNKKALSGLVIVLILFLVVPHSVSANGMMDKIYEGLGWIILSIAGAIGKLTTVLIGWLITIASYDKFIETPVVIEGWKVVRDVANMFFVVVLLIISFATILRYDDEYNIKKLLPKVVMMAVLINFSKTICGIILEVAQVFMLTFITAIGTAGGNNLVSLLGMDKMLEFGKANSLGSSSIMFDVVVGLVVGLIAIIIVLVIIIAFIAMLIMRMVMLWILIILSPLAYLTAAFPQGRKYSSQWWGEFTSNVISGPVMAFFLWLALSTADSTTKALNALSLSNNLNSSGGGSTVVNVGSSVSDFLSGPALSSYIVTVGLLVGTLIITKQIGGVAATAAGKAISTLQSGRAAATKRLKAGAVVGAKFAGRNALGVAGYGLQKVKFGGIDKVGQLASNWRNDLRDTRLGDKKSKRLETLKKLGMGEKSMASLKDVADSKLGRGMKTGVATAAAIGAVAAGAPIAVPVAAALAATIQRFRTKNLERKEKDKAVVDKAKKDRSDSETKARAEFDNKTDVYKKRLESRLKGAEANRDTRLAAEKARFESGALSALGYKTNIQTIQRDYDRDVKRHQDEFNNAPEVDTAKKTLTAAMDAAADEFKKKIGGINPEIKVGDWHPNQTTMGAVKSGIKDITNARHNVSQLAGDTTIDEFDKGAFYSASGQTAQQKKFFEELTSGSKDSAEAIKKITASITGMADQIARGQDLSKGQNAVMESFKQGVAAFKKNGGDVSSLSGVITVVNNVRTGDGSNAKHTKTVQDFESSVK